MSTIWGIDLGGTKIEGVVLESALKPNVLARFRLPTEGEKGYKHVLSQISLVIKQLEQIVGCSPSALGIGTPGSLDTQTQLLKGSNSQHLNGKPFKQDLATLLGIPVEVANDANCFALAETTMGSVKELLPKAGVVFGVIMGTGVGGGLVVGNKVINGRHGIAGEWGHTFLNDDGELCYCGHVGCVESILAGPALERYYLRISGSRIGLKEIYNRYLNGTTDQYAVLTIERLIMHFGRAIANLVNTIDPDAIVIGGGVGNIDILYSKGVEEVRKYVFNPTFTTPILKPKLGDSAGVFGAAFLVA